MGEQHFSQGDQRKLPCRGDICEGVLCEELREEACQRREQQVREPLGGKRPNVFNQQESQVAVTAVTSKEKVG